MEERINDLVYALKGMDDSDLIALWNEYCSECNYDDDHIYSMDEFNELNEGIFEGLDRTPLDIVTCIQIDLGNFHAGDDYYFINGYGHYISFHSLEWAGEGCPFDYDTLAEAIAEGSVDIRGYDAIEELMDEEE